MMLLSNPHSYQMQIEQGYNAARSLRVALRKLAEAKASDFRQVKGPVSLGTSGLNVETRGASPGSSCSNLGNGTKTLRRLAPWHARAKQRAQN